MFERFTDRARQVIVLAQDESRLLDHAHIGTEHLLLGLDREGGGVAAQVLSSLEISLEKIRTEVENAIGRGEVPRTGPIPFTPRAKKVMELSLREALQLGHSYIGTEHILLGLLREGDGVAARVLRQLGATLPDVRQRILGLLGGSPSPEGLVASPPGCPHCGAALAEEGAYRTITVPAEKGDERRDFVVLYCRSCGRAVAGTSSP
jgi:ATP-dependent Clp protease ATP-binding subunit ClpC